MLFYFKHCLLEKITLAVNFPIFLHERFCPLFPPSKIKLVGEGWYSYSNNLKHLTLKEYIFFYYWLRLIVELYLSLQGIEQEIKICPFYQMVYAEWESARCVQRSKLIKKNRQLQCSKWTQALRLVRDDISSWKLETFVLEGDTWKSVWDLGFSWDRWDVCKSPGK